ncbi:MAG TPA: hypothetical protein VGQ62_24730 [Chloroflexota bacterium]|nr:hypothetical protein [Chloroflexota bacterium]
MAATTTKPTPSSGGERPSSVKGKRDVAAPVARRVYWRAVVRTGSQVAASRERDRVEWHLAGCTAPSVEGNHCSEGGHLIETIGHPDGHCIIDGVCGLCGAPAPKD